MSAGLGLSSILNVDWIRKLEKYLETIERQENFLTKEQKHSVMAYSFVSRVHYALKLIKSMFAIF